MRFMIMYMHKIIVDKVQFYRSLQTIREAIIMKLWKSFHESDGNKRNLVTPTFFY